MFELTEEGLALTEVTPGIDIERDIASQMDFRPVMKRPPRHIDERIFIDSPMGLRNILLRLDLSERASAMTQRRICSSSISKVMK